MQSTRLRSSNEDDRDRQIISIDHFASQTAYSHWVPAIDWDDDGSGATYVAPTATVPGHWQFTGAAAEAAEYVYCYLRRPENWHRGHIEAVLHYGGSSSTGNYSAILGYSFSMGNTAFTAITQNMAIITVPVGGTARLLIAKPKDTVDTSYASPTWATEEINPKAVGAYAVAVPPVHDGLYFQFGRDSTHVSDTSTGSLRMYGIELLFFPHEGAVGHSLSSDYYRDDSRI